MVINTASARAWWQEGDHCLSNFRTLREVLVSCTNIRHEAAESRMQEHSGWVSWGLREKKHFFQQDSSDLTERRARLTGNKLVGGSSSISKTNSHQLTLPFYLHYLS